MRRTSKKRTQQTKEYNKKRAEYLHNTPLCERCGPQFATEVHHKAGRNGERLIDSRYFMAVCRSCHEYIHNNPNESYKKGWLLRK